MIFKKQNIAFFIFNIEQTCPSPKSEEGGDNKSAKNSRK